MERVKGIEPSLSAWEAEVLPLNYTRFVAQFYPVPECGQRLLKKRLKSVLIWVCRAPVVHPGVQ